MESISIYSGCLATHCLKGVKMSGLLAVILPSIFLFGFNLEFFFSFSYFLIFPFLYY